MRYKVDVLQKLKDAGYSTYKLRKDKILGEATIQSIRNGEIVSINQIERICALIGCDIGDLLTVEQSENQNIKINN